MPTSLRRSDRAVDRAVDGLYRRRRFDTERDRLEHLLSLYERMYAPIAAAAATKKKRRRRARRAPRTGRAR